MTFLIPICSSVLTLAVLHPVPDGLVFRGIQVVARSDRIEVRYQVGISDQMVGRELLKQMSDDAVVPTGAVEALACYRDEMFPKIVRGIGVTMDGKPTELIPMRADIVRQPHAQLEFVYQIPFAPTVEPVKFVLLDENYAAVPGYHLAAIRGRGDVQVLPAGPDQLFDRLPSIPSPTDGEAAPIPSVRKIEAYISGSAPAVEEAGDGSSVSDAAQEVGAADRMTAAPYERRSIQDTESGESGRAHDASDGSISDAEHTGQIDHNLDSTTGRIVWASVFAALALTIAVFWIRGAGGGK